MHESARSMAAAISDVAQDLTGNGPDRLMEAELTSGVANELIYRAEIKAEGAIAGLRLAVAILLVALLAASDATIEVSTGVMGIRPSWPSLIMISGFILTSLAAYALISARRYRPQMGWVFAVLDVSISVAALAEGTVRNNLPGNDLFLLATAWSGPVVLAFNALRYRPAIVAGAAVFYILGGLGVASWAGLTLMGAPPRSEYAHFANLPANTIRIGLLGLVGLCLTIVVRRGRRLLLRALVEQQRLSTLVRFLPGEVASEILRPSSRLRPGMDLECAILFIDLRDSTRLMERMPPEQIADFLIRFRRRITRIVRQHRGIIEKFAGDGALIVFGVSDPQPDDCRRALACGRHFIKSMEEWNARRDQGAHLRLAAGIHAGRCFCGIVGDESRQEFTVLGDTVNVAARLEEIAKQRDLCLVASREILMRAGEDLGGRSWQPLGIQRIRGYGGALEIYAYHPS